MSWRSRALISPESVGGRLQQLRQEAHLTIEAVAAELQIAVKHLQSIEASRYQDLPGKVYARNFARRYIERMGLNVETAMEQFDKEYDVLTVPQQRRNPILPQRANAEHPWWYRHGRIVMASVVVALVAGYFGWQIIRLVTPPTLAVTQPAEDALVTAATYTIKGVTEEGAEVRINNETSTVTADGSFAVDVDLQPGVNTLKISAKKKRSGERTIVRQILYEVPKE